MSLHLANAQHHLSTQLTLALSFLRSHAHPIRIEELAILSGVEGLLEEDGELLRRFLAHERVGRVGETGLVVYKPDFAISSPSDLLHLLRKHAHSAPPTAPGGLSIKKLKESWAGVGPAIDELEREGKVLVSRPVRKGAGRDGTKEEEGRGGKMVFLDEVAGRGSVEREFVDLWKTLKTPDKDLLADELVAAGLSTSSTLTTSTSANANDGKGKKKKKGAGSRKLKFTNTHLGGEVDLSRDYVPTGSSAAPKKK